MSYEGEGRRDVPIYTLLRLSVFTSARKRVLPQFVGELMKDVIKSVPLFPSVELPSEGKSYIGHKR